MQQWSNAMNQLAIVLNEVAKSERLVEDALRLVSSVPGSQTAEKGSIERLLAEARLSLKVARVFVRIFGTSAEFLQCGIRRRFPAAESAGIGNQA